MIKTAERQAVLDKTGGKCAYCGEPLTLKNLTVDHVEPIVRPLEVKNGVVATADIKGTAEQEHIDNKLPACRSCNSYKNSLSLEDFRKRIEHFPELFVDNNPTFRAMIRFGLIELTNKPLVFEYEKQGLEIGVSND